MKPVILLSMLLLATASAHAGDADLRRCRALADAALRLACYDALPLAPLAPGAPPPAAAAAPATAAAPAAASFGIARPDDALQEITSHIPGRFEGWSPNARLRLANGQVWQVTDDSRAYVNDVQDPKVTVRRAAMGSFVMEIEGSRRAPRVRRVE